MATPYPSGQVTEWQERNPSTGVDSTNFRSVTPAMNNTRGGFRNASPARGVPPATPAGSAVGAHYSGRAGTPSGRYDSFSNPDPNQTPSAGNPSNGLMRLTLRKPMGIVFEPMYDPNNPSTQRGVRICDLPRTGAAALSRKLEIGDELLSINDKTMSRLTFDEIMDFIIEADPEEVNLLFRRPKKDAVKERTGVKIPSASSGPGVKWVDDDTRNKKESKKKTSSKNDTSYSGSRKDKKSSRRSKSNRDDDTMQSEEVEYRSNRRKKGRSRKDPYESESFLDMLIDTVCANPDCVFRDRQGENDSYSDEDESFASRDDSTYVTYESEDRRKKKGKQKKRTDDDSSYDDAAEAAVEEKRKKKETKRPSPIKETKRTATPEKPRKYEDDGTLETVDSADRANKARSVPQPEVTPAPLGLLPNPPPSAVPTIETDDEGNPAPIKELQYDDQVDHGADVSVMESLGGPSLLVEQQRKAAAVSKEAETTAPVSREIMDNFGKDYPLDFGFTRDQTIQNDPLRFYTFVVKGLLQEHEPEKVRLLDKLLAKYRGREDHLVKKLSVRYTKEAEEEEGNFEEAVQKGKDSDLARANVQTATERLQQADFSPSEWPDKETKEPELEDEQPKQPEDEEDDGSASEFSGDSIDGTSPAVIAQVSELLNYVYGKTSVPGQIDRVSTIMRAYEGREAVLLELLETKALIKANREKENAGALPSFLRNSANAQRTLEGVEAGDMPPVTPMATQGAAITDDISSMSGVSSPTGEQANGTSINVLKQLESAEPSAKHAEAKIRETYADHAPTPTSAISKPTPTPDRPETKKKKKGLFGGLFKKGKKSKAQQEAERSSSQKRGGGLRSPMSRKLKNEGSI